MFKVKLHHWEAVEDRRWKRRTDIQNLEVPVEVKLAEIMELCYIEGKKKKNRSKNALVPIIFTEESVVGIRLLIKHRSMMGIDLTNKYIFASGDLSLTDWDTLQGITKRINNLKKPKLLTPTRTRKFLATLLQLMDMNDAELTWLTNHFGHTKDVHFQWYRKEDATLELTKVAKVLMAVDDGQSVKNKMIDQISTVEQTPGSSCCNSINSLKKVWKDKSPGDRPSHPGMKIYFVSAWLDSSSIVEIFILLVPNTH